MKYLGKILMLIFFIPNAFLLAQTDTVLLAKKGEFEYSWLYSSYTPVFDKQGNPFVYTASMELGLVVFDISDFQNSTPVDTIMPAELNSKFKIY